MIKVEQSAEPRRFSNGAFGATGWLIGEGDDIVESLMVAFVLMVGKVFIEGVAQGTIAEENQLVETLIFD